MVVAPPRSQRARRLVGLAAAGVDRRHRLGGRSRLAMAAGRRLCRCRFPITPTLTNWSSVPSGSSRRPSTARTDRRSSCECCAAAGTTPIRWRTAAAAKCWGFAGDAVVWLPVEECRLFCGLPQAADDDCSEYDGKDLCRRRRHGWPCLCPGQSVPLLRLAAAGLCVRGLRTGCRRGVQAQVRRRPRAAQARRLARCSRPPARSRLPTWQPKPPDSQRSS